MTGNIRSKTELPPLAGMPSMVLSGTKKDDILAALGDGYVVLGLEGEDVLTSAFNRTVLDGGKHDDTLDTDVELSGEPGKTVEAVATQFGGHGNDALHVRATAQFGAEVCAYAKVDGGKGDDDITVATLAIQGDGQASNEIDGGDGDDHIEALAYVDPLFSNAVATNVIAGGSGDDVIYATADIEIQSAPDRSMAVNVIDGGDGNDIIHALATGDFEGEHTVSRNELTGGAGHDSLTAEAVVQSNGGRIAVNLLDGGEGNDVLAAHGFGNSNSVAVDVHNTLIGGDGHDILIAEGVTVFSTVNTVKNTLDGGHGNDTLVAKADVDWDGPFADVTNALSGGDGQDNLKAIVEILFDGSPDVKVENVLDGGHGNDILSAEMPLPEGSPGRSVLDGGEGADLLEVEGGDGNELDGGPGNDVLVSGDGDEFMIGGSGADLLVFGPDSGEDVIVDFEDGLDHIDVREYGFTDLSDLTVLNVGSDALVRFTTDDEVTVADAAELLGAEDFWFA